MFSARARLSEAALLWRWSKPAYEYGSDAAEAQPMAAAGRCGERAWENLMFARTHRSVARENHPEKR
jgi:hypothetical protein